MNSSVFITQFLRHLVTFDFGPGEQHWSAFAFVTKVLGEITGLLHTVKYERWRLTETEKILVPSFTQCF